MNQLSIEKRAQILRLLTEGVSMRATARLADCAFNTVASLLIQSGKVCAAYQDAVLRSLPCKVLQCDEIWTFCFSKEKNVPEPLKGKGRGDVWTWIAMCADTKLIPCWYVGNRDLYAAKCFMDDLASRLTRRIQLTTDGHRPYVEAVEGAFGSEIDYAMLVKMFGSKRPKEKEITEVKYSQAACAGILKIPVKGKPVRKLISTSFVERCNLTLRMSNRRFTRLTNAFSKKLENLRCSVALHMMFYNFCRIHQTLRVTPAMEAGVTDHVWSLEEVAALEIPRSN